MMRRLRGDRGSVMPVFLVLSLVTAMIGVFFFQIGRATDLSAKAQTGSDAAALAAADDLRDQIIEYLMSGSYAAGNPFIPNYPRAAADAFRYALDNDVVISFPTFTQIGYLKFEVHVEGRTRETLDPAGYADTDPTDGQQGEFLLGNGENAEQDATAGVGPGAASFLTGGFYTNGGNAGGFGPGASGSPTSTSGGCALSDGDITALATQAGVDIGGNPQSTVLGRYEDCDGGVSIQPMAEEMKMSLLRLEAAMGEPLQLASGYRSPAYQAQLCRRVSGPCAAPGRSMHNIGLAVDVVNYQTAARAANSDPSIGLCQPLPSNDAVHLSHRSGRECGGNTGTAGGGAGGGGWRVFGGVANLRVQAGIVVTLVD